jgi:Rod binding domain-containing protein
MSIPALQHSVRAAEIAPERLAGNSRLNEKEKVAEASRQFESILLRQILQEAQKPVVHTKLNTDSTAKGIYRDMVTTRLADSISRSGEFGLARTFAQQLNGPDSSGTQSAPSAQPGSVAAATSRPGTAAARPPHWPFADSHRLLEARTQKASLDHRAGAVAHPLSTSARNANLNGETRKPKPALRAPVSSHRAGRFLATHDRTLP